MLNNNSNINNIDGSSDTWTKKVTGSNNYNNSAIINNTGNIEEINGSLMLIGNAVENKTTRQVTIKDNLRIGKWELSQGSDGKLQFNKDGKSKMTFGSNGIDVPSSQINKVNIRDNNINGVTIKTDASAVTTLTANSINVKDSITMVNITAGNSYAGGNTFSKNIYTNNIIANGGNHSFGDIVVGRYGWGSPNGGGGIHADGEIYVRNNTDTKNSDTNINGDLIVNNSLRSKTDHIVLAPSGSVRAINQLARFERYEIARTGQMPKLT